MKTIRFWLKNARSIALPQSVMPAVLAVCMASRWEGFSVITGLMAVVGVIAGHLGINLLDDYFDYKVKKTDYRMQMEHKGMRARISKCTYLTSGEATMKQLWIACCIFSTVALVIGVVVFLFRGPFILFMALMTGLLGFFYSGPPFRLSYRGFGEILIGLMFGPMLMTGVFFAACGVFDPSVLFVSIPVGLLVTNIVYSHAIMDYEPDKAVGKMTLAGLIKNRTWMLVFLALILLLSFGLIVSGVVSKYLSPYYLASFLTLPLAINLFYLMIQFVRHPERSYSPRFWMGPMNNWEKIQAVGIDWFMIRWLSARNLLGFFCILLMVVSLVE